LAGLLAGLRRLDDGLRLALTTFTVAPVRAERLDRATAATAMVLGPLVGAGLGLVLAGSGLALRAAGAGAPAAGVVSVVLGVLLTRALHLDGLADTADGLGSYRDAEGALAIMKRSDIGPFGVAAIVLVLLVQVAAAATAFARPWPAAIATVVAVTAAGRAGVTVACRRGVPAARGTGLGALVAGTVGRPWIVLDAAVPAVIGAFAVPGRPWLGPVAVVVSLGAVWLLVRHATRRLGGVTGDVLGAAVEIGTAVAYLVLAL
jgi:adenosylcobinamide-GDP ribazoletransferase